MIPLPFLKNNALVNVNSGSLIRLISSIDALEVALILVVKSVEIGRIKSLEMLIPAIGRGIIRNTKKASSNATVDIPLESLTTQVTIRRIGISCLLKRRLTKKSILKRSEQAGCITSKPSVGKSVMLLVSIADAPASVLQVEVIPLKR